MLYARSAVRDGSDLGIGEASGEDRVAAAPAPITITDVEGSYEFVAEATKNAPFVFDVGFGEVFVSHGQITGKSLEQKVDLFCTDPA